jgi:hypothetical protein
VVGRLDGRVALGDVVDAALDDQRLGVAGAVVEAAGDLVGALAGDAAVADLERRRGALGPVPVLAARVVARPERCALGGIGVIARRAGGDRVAERGDRQPGLVAGGCALAVARPAARERERARDRREEPEPAYMYMPPNWPPVTFNTWPWT